MNFTTALNESFNESFLPYLGKTGIDIVDVIRDFAMQWDNFIIKLIYLAFVFEVLNSAVLPMLNLKKEWHNRVYSLLNLGTSSMLIFVLIHFHIQGTSLLGYEIFIYAALGLSIIYRTYKYLKNKLYLDDLASIKNIQSSIKKATEHINDNLDEDKKE